MLNKEKHFSCNNCERRTRVTFTNKIVFCFGLIKKLYKPKDFYRFCIIRGKNKSANDIMVEELYAMLRGLSEVLFDKRLLDINKRHEQKKNASKRKN